MVFTRHSWVTFLSRCWIWVQQHRWIALALLVLGIGLLAFVQVADELEDQHLHVFDLFVHNLLRPYRADWIYRGALLLSALVVWPTIVIIAAPFEIYLLVTRRFATFWGFLLITFSSMAIISLMKILFDRHRPLTALILEPGNSFPSGHASGSTVFYGLLGYITCKYLVRGTTGRLLVSLATMLLILLTGLARIFLEVHYASDVVAGWAAGACLLAGGLILLEYWQPKRER